MNTTAATQLRPRKENPNYHEAKQKKRNPLSFWDGADIAKKGTARVPGKREVEGRGRSHFGWGIKQGSRGREEQKKPGRAGIAQQLSALRKEIGTDEEL